MSEPKVSNQQLQAYLQDRMEGVTYSWEWPKLQDAMHDLLDIRRRIAELEAQLSGELKHRIQARTSKPEWQSFLTLKYGEARTILVLLQDGQISVCKACEALAELAHGVSPRIPEPQGEPLSDDVVPSKRIAELDAALAQQKQMYEQEAKWRKAYQEAKGKMYALGGQVFEAAWNLMPCNESQIDSWFHTEYVYREAYEKLEAQLAEAKKDGERLARDRDTLLKELAGAKMRTEARLVSEVEELCDQNEDGNFILLALAKRYSAAIAAAAAEGEKG